MLSMCDRACDEDHVHDSRCALWKRVCRFCSPPIRWFRARNLPTPTPPLPLGPPPPQSIGRALLHALLHWVLFSLGWYLQLPHCPSPPVPRRAPCERALENAGPRVALPQLLHKQSGLQQQGFKCGLFTLDAKCYGGFRRAVGRGMPGECAASLPHAHLQSHGGHGGSQDVLNLLRINYARSHLC